MIKYVPLECIGFKSNYERYYQITAIDLYSRKRILKLVNENSSYETSNMLKRLERDFGFKIKTIQTDNGREFCNDSDQKKSGFERALEYLNIEYIRTRPYSPRHWPLRSSWVSIGRMWPPRNRSRVTRCGWRGLARWCIRC